MSSDKFNPDTPVVENNNTSIPEPVYESPLEVVDHTSAFIGDSLDGYDYQNDVQNKK